MEALTKDTGGSNQGKKLMRLIQELKVSGEQEDALAEAILAYVRYKEVSTAQSPQSRLSEAEENGLPPRSIIEGLQMLAPRGRFNVLFYEGHACLKSSKQSFLLPYSSIHTVAIFDKVPNDTRKRVLLFLGMGESESGKDKSSLKSAIIQVGSDAKLDIQSPTDPSNRLTGLAAIVLCQAFGEVGANNVAFVAPTKDCFSATGGHLAVEALVGVNSGWLFPLLTALCFLERPALWIKHSSIDHVETARTSERTRSFALFVHQKSGEVTEFNNIPRSNLDVLLEYIAKSGIRLCVAPGEDGGVNIPDSAGAAEGSEDSDEEDSDFDPEHSNADGKDVPQLQEEEGDVEESDGEESGDEDSQAASSEGEDSDSEVSVVSDEGVPSAKIKQLVAANKQGEKKRKRMQ